MPEQIFFGFLAASSWGTSTSHTDILFSRQN